MKKLPIGLQTFEKIIKEDYLYIDKTDIALELIENYSYSFLSRPRRFGKSLFLDTLKNIFEGKKELFKGLYIYDKWEFEEYPVIKIDWAGDFKTLESTKQVVLDIFEENQKRLGIECKMETNPSSCFNQLIKEAYEKYKKPVVILIDEYDKPILDNIENIERANENRDFLRGIYVQMKANDAYIKFAFLTGITKFSKASIFSGLNNLEDISLVEEFGNICGYTQQNIENEFKEYLKDVNLEKLKEWYNGYNFLGDKVYNPFDILQFIKNKFKFKNYWFQSGNAYNLITLLQNKKFFLPELENIEVDETILDSFDIEKLKIESLLFQAGYLTIDNVDYDDEFIIYKLKTPNKEVQISLNKLFLDYLSDITISPVKLRDTKRALMNENLESLKTTLISLFASLPYNNYSNNNIAHFEGYYASVIYAYLASLGLEIIAEDVTNKGRMDLTIKLSDKIYIIEFKVGDEDALQQIKDKNYAEKYLNENKDIYLVGINFDEKEKNINKFEWEKIK